jgi:pilus assembly protein CpaB
MQRRGFIGLLAVAVAIVGAVLLVFYVNGADARAMAGQQPTKVLVVIRDVPLGTPAGSLAQFTQARELPAAAVVAGAISDTAQLKATDVASTTLRIGEQVLASRFVAAGSNEVTAPVPIPEGMQLVSIQLDPERVVGSQLNAGDTVAVFLNLKVKDKTVTGNVDEVAVTHIIANQVLVARTQGAVTTPNTQQTAGPTEQLPKSAVIVTLAVNAPLAERIVFGQLNGSLWLAKETPTSSTTGTRIVHSGNVFQ